MSGAHGSWYEGCRRARGPAGCYPATTACTVNMACGSMHWATMSSPGTSVGPFVTCVPCFFTVLANSTVLCHSEPLALPDQKGLGESEPTLSPGRVPRVAGSGLFGAAAHGWPLDHSVRGHRARPSEGSRSGHYPSSGVQKCLVTSVPRFRATLHRRDQFVCIESQMLRSMAQRLWARKRSLVPSGPRVVCYRSPRPLTCEALVELALRIRRTTRRFRPSPN